MPTGIYKRTKPAWNKGIPRSQDVKDAISKANKGKLAGDKNPSKRPEVKKKLSDGKKGKKNPNFGMVFSKERRKKYSKLFSGNRNPNWKGGLSLVARQARRCFNYRQWHSDVFTRDDFTCQICGKRGGKLEADHYPKLFITIFQENKIETLEEAINCEEFWNINNGRTLCKNCHQKYGKKR